MTMQDGKTLREWFDALDTERRCMLDRKREHSRMTLPALLPWEGRVVNTQLDVPYDSNTAEGINDLSSRMTSIIFPLNGQSPFEIQNVTEFQAEPQDDSDLQEVFTRFAQYTMATLAPTNLRSQINLAYNHLMAIGDVLLHQLDDFSFRLYRADQFVVRRKHEGDWVDIIIAESVNREWHPELQAIGGNPDPTRPANLATGEEEWELLYTHVHKDPTTKKITITQEFRDTQVGEKREEDVSEYMPIRWKSIIGEAYGVSLVEENFGDVRTLDALAKALLDGTLLNAEYRWGVNPAGLTEMQDMLDSINGDFVPTAPGDVFPLQFQNAAQVQSTLLAVQHKQNILNRKFLKSETRDAERVTAREIQKDAQTIEGKLGGVLSSAGIEIQDPIVRHTLYLMTQKNMIPKEISDEINKQDGLVKLRIRAGLEILNREAEREKLDSAIERMRNLPPEALEAFVWTEIARDWWQSLGLETVGRVKTGEQLQQERQQSQQQALQAQAAQAGIQAGAQATANGDTP